MTPRRRWALGALATTLALHSRPVAAQAQGNAADMALAEALFRDGRALMKSGSTAEACGKFAESLRLDPKTGTLLNLAICHEQQGHTASAWAEYVDVATRARRDGHVEREQFAAGRASALEPKLVRVRFAIDTPAPGLQIALDGRRLPAPALVGTALPVDPGSHHVEAWAPGRRGWSSAVAVAAASGITIVRVPPLAPETASAAVSGGVRSQGSEGARGSRTLAYASLGVGVVGVAAGSVFGIRTLAKKRDAEPHCDATTCDHEGITLQSDARTASTLSTIGFGVGLAGLGLGAYMLLRAKSMEAQVGVRIVPSVATSQIGLTAQGAW